MRVAFIGLGVMGFPMAGHLAAAGFDVTVYNRTRAKAEAWVAAHGGQLAQTPAEAAKGAELVFTCVGNDADLSAVITGPQGAAAGHLGPQVGPQGAPGVLRGTPGEPQWPPGGRQ